jgi:hypothetical protein
MTVVSCEDRIKKQPHYNLQSKKMPNPKNKITINIFIRPRWVLKNLENCSELTPNKAKMNITKSGIINIKL